jgi:hypothetical protein
MGENAIRWFWGERLPNPDSLRIAECIQLVFVCVLVLASQLRPLNRIRRLRVALLAFVAIALIAAARFSARWISPLASSILRDWLPAALMLVPYWQVGQFFTKSDPATEARLTNFDRVFFRSLLSPGWLVSATKLLNALTGIQRPAAKH